MAGKKKAFLSPPKKLRKTERRVGAPALSTPPARRQPSKLAPSVAQSPDGSPATPRRQPDNLDELEGRFQEALNNLDESLSTVAPVLKLMFVTLLAALPNRAPQPRPQTPGAETKRLGKDLRAHARESLGLVIKGGICVENKKKRSRFGQAIRTVKRAAWQRACVEGWMLDNGVDSTAQEGLHGVMRSYSNNVDQAAGDRSHFVASFDAHQSCSCVRWASLVGVAAALLFFQENRWIQIDGTVNFEVKNEGKVLFCLFV